MGGMTLETDELTDLASIRLQESDQNREIKKWHAIAKMVDINPDVLQFSLSITEPERRWAFFAQASGILYQSLTREINEVGDRADASSAAIF
jgi:hypothetical protein